MLFQTLLHPFIYFSPTPAWRSEGSCYLFQALGASGQGRGRKLSPALSKKLTSSSPSKPGKKNTATHAPRHTDTRGHPREGTCEPSPLATGSSRGIGHSHVLDQRALTQDHHTHDPGDLTRVRTPVPQHKQQNRAHTGSCTSLSPMTCDLTKLLLNGEDCSWVARTLSLV